MRQAINNNPVVQIAVIGVMIAAAGLLFSMRVLNREEVVPEDPATVTTSASVSTPQGDVSVTAEVTPSAEGLAAGAAAPVPSTDTGVVTPEALVPGPGLPVSVVDAYKSGDAVVLLIVRPGAVDDRLVTSAVRTLSGRSDVTTFVVRADKVARFSRITQPVDVSRVPALVVIRPKRLSGKTPEATVTYGFRTANGVVQAVQDALYTGKTNVPYYPG
jgi:hypothetical protein